ncbi:MAG: hypothetical protein JST85_14130 [Acidobacteria bacterium]|nr:hypothetical protein [Acidobacteriota bacterium]
MGRCPVFKQNIEFEMNDFCVWKSVADDGVSSTVLVQITAGKAWPRKNGNHFSALSEKWLVKKVCQGHKERNHTDTPCHKRRWVPSKSCGDQPIGAGVELFSQKKN